MFIQMVGPSMKLKIFGVFAILICAGMPALAQIDLSGSWTSKNHEDAMERGAGPNPDDWAGLLRRWWQRMQRFCSSTGASTAKRSW